MLTEYLIKNLLPHKPQVPQPQSQARLSLFYIVFEWDFCLACYQKTIKVKMHS